MNRYLAIVLVLLVGCAPTAKREAVRHHSGAAAAVELALAQPSANPQPTPPGPTPIPSEICARCNGTGRIKPDGRIEINCPDCGGDGRLTMSDVLVATRQQIAEATADDPEVVASLKKGLADAQQLRRELEALTPPPKPPVSRDEVARVMDLPMDQLAKLFDVTPPVGVDVSDVTLGKAITDRLKPPPRIEQPRESLSWFGTLADVQLAASREGKPALIHYTGGDECVACVRMDEDVFPNREVARELRGFVLAKIVTKEPGLTVPVDYVVTADWSTKRKLDFTLDPADFAEQLRDAKAWATTRRTVNGQSTNPQPSTLNPQSSERIVYVQSGGSAGGSYSGGSAGGYGGVRYVQQPTYTRPTYFVRPNPSGATINYGAGWWNTSSGPVMGNMSCGPNGCFVQ